MNYSENVGTILRLPTTEIYAKSNLELKRKAIEEASNNVLPQETLTTDDKEVLLDWLK